MERAEPQRLNRSGPGDVPKYMMIRAMTVLALAAGFLMVGGGVAHACSCASPSAAERVQEAAAVFTATAADVRVDEAMLDGGRVTATLRADHVYKGAARAEFQVVTRAQGPACGYDFTTGMRYLVFAHDGDEGLTTSLCSGNKVLAPGGGALTPSDGGVDAELLAALGTPTAIETSQPARTDGGFSVTLAAFAVAVAGVAMLMLAFVRRRTR